MRERSVAVALGSALLPCMPTEIGAQAVRFRAPHLYNIEQPVTLEYEYRHETRPGESFVDTVAMTVPFDLNGSRVADTLISVTPVVGDTYRKRLGEYEHTVYMILVSSAVPGGIYRMHSTVPSPTVSGKPIIQDTLTYRGFRH